MQNEKKYRHYQNKMAAIARMGYHIGSRMGRGRLERIVPFSSI